MPNPIDPNTWNQDFITHYGRVGWDHVFTGNLLNHVKLGYNRTNSNNNAASVNYGVDWPAKLGLTGVSGLTFPQFNINSGFPSIGQARGDDDVGNEADIVDTLSWTRGRHTMTMGGEYRWIQYNNLAYDN